MSRNTKVSYYYRCGANYKHPGEIILPGTPKQGVKDFERALTEACDVDGQFIAHQVKVPERFPWMTGEGSYNDQYDHCFHTLLNVEIVREAPNSTITPEQLVAAFEKAHRDGWKVFDPQLRELDEIADGVSRAGSLSI